MELNVRDLTPTQAKYKAKHGRGKKINQKTWQYKQKIMICLELGTNKTQNVCNRRKLLSKF